MKNALLCCLVVLMSSSVYAQSLCEGGGEGQGQSLTDQQKKDLEARCLQARRAEARQEVVAVGIDDRDCIERVQRKAERKVRDVIQSCESQAQNLYRCELSSSRITEVSDRIDSVRGAGEYVERESTEEACRASSISQAERNALSLCHDKYEVDCRLSQRGVVTDFHVAKRRRYWIVGPKNNYQMCTATAAAEPDASYRVQCSVEIRAQVRVF